MTTSIRDHVRARGRRGEGPEAPTLAGLFVERLRVLRDTETRITWPSERYRTDPVAFFEEVLGVVPWSGQRRLLEAVAKHRRVSCRSGRRVSKSMNAGGIGLWRYCSWPLARVVLSSTTARQVDAILWRELSMLRAKAGRCISCLVDDPAGRGPRPCRHSALIDGEIGMLARTGLKNLEDFREIFGATAREGEAMQGLAGPALQFIVDEASGVPPQIFEAIEGNLAGGGWSLYLGNPTKTHGPFYDSHGVNKYDEEHPERGGIFSLVISSEESPNVNDAAREDLAARFDRIAARATTESARVAARARALGIREKRVDVQGTESRDAIRGLANKEWIAEREREWGRESPLFRVHVLGEFATHEDGKIFSVDRIEEAKTRWVPEPTRRELEEALARGLVPARLHLGVDPAGETGTGDETAITPRRGWNAEAPIVARGLDSDGHLRLILDVIAARTLPREQPVVTVDRTGSIGAELFARLAAHADQCVRDRLPAPFVLVGLKFSDKAPRSPDVFDTQRDELFANLEIAFREGAGIAEDAKLEQELHVLEWRTLPNGRTKVTSKDEIRKAIGRSPDRLDSLALAFWQETALVASNRDAAASTPEAARSAARVHESRDDFDDVDPTDPFDAARAWRR